MATYVLVHGGGHGGWCYQKVARLLRAEGHEVHCPTLTGLGERVHLLNPDVDLDIHITDVVNTLHYEDLRDVILAGHSYGGMVITGVADRALDRVGHLVYLDAALPRNGESLADVAPEMMAAAHEGARVIDGVELVVFPGEDPLNNFGVTDPDDIAWMSTRLQPQPWKTFAQPLSLEHEDAVLGLPRTIINTQLSLDMLIQKNRARLFDAERVWTMDTGHDLMITEPEALVEMLGRLADL